MTRECPVRFCERLGVKLPGATHPPGTMCWTRKTLPQADSLHVTNPPLGKNPRTRRKSGIYMYERAQVVGPSVRPSPAAGYWQPVAGTRKPGNVLRSPMKV